MDRLASSRLVPCLWSDNASNGTNSGKWITTNGKKPEMKRKRVLTTLPLWRQRRKRIEGVASRVVSKAKIKKQGTSDAVKAMKLGMRNRGGDPIKFLKQFSACVRKRRVS